MKCIWSRSKLIHLSARESLGYKQHIGPISLYIHYIYNVMYTTADSIERKKSLITLKLIGSPHCVRYIKSHTFFVTFRPTCFTRYNQINDIFIYYQIPNIYVGKDQRRSITILYAHMQRILYDDCIMMRILICLWCT